MDDRSESVRLRNLARPLIRNIVTDETGNYVTTGWWVMSLELILADSLDDPESAQSMAKLIIERYESQPFRRLGSSLHAALAYAILGDRETAIDKVVELERLGLAFYRRDFLTDQFEENHLNDIDLSNDVAYQLAVRKMEQRNEALAARLMVELPELQQWGQSKVPE